MFSIELEPPIVSSSSPVIEPFLSKINTILLHSFYLCHPPLFIINIYRKTIFHKEMVALKAGFYEPSKGCSKVNKVSLIL